MCAVIEDQRRRFDDWSRPHVPLMTALAARLASDADADDVVQDSLVRAWQRWADFDGRRGTARSWLLAIVADQARQRRRRAAPAALPLHDAAGRAVLAESGEDVDLRAAVARLPERQRLAVECHYYLDLPVRETALVMRCAAGTVKSTLAAARASLRADLGEDYG